MTKFRNNKPNKNQGIHTIFGQHSVKAALQNDKREHIELIISKNQANFTKKYESKVQKITIIPQNEFMRRFGNENTTQGVVLKTKDFVRPGLEEFVKLESKKSKSVIIILDQVTDPQNIGSIMRSCALF
jgi:rRNA methylases